MKSSSAPILIVDDEPRLLQSLDIILRSGGIGETELCLDSRQVASRMAEREPELVLLDLDMPHLDGLQVFKRIANDFPDVPVIIATANSDLETAVSLIKEGAFDYVVKPIAKERLLSTVNRALEVRALRRENIRLREHMLKNELDCPEAFEAFNAVSAVMRALFRYVESVAVGSAPILIAGETGSGKELMARCLYRLGNYAGELVGVNIAGLDETAFSDTLFGHRKGAFTGADAVREGLIEKAKNGMLFLDEIGDLSQTLQVRLLRLLQEREYFPLGSDMPRKSHCRIVCSTHRDLAGLSETGEFRKDLYYRLRHHQIRIPPLRERPDDLPPLLNALVASVARDQGKPAPPVSDEVYPLLLAYDFPGNVRELEAMATDALARHEHGTLAATAFRSWTENERRRRRIRPATVAPHPSPPDPGLAPSEVARPAACSAAALPSLKMAAEALVRRAMQAADNNQAQAARLLGVSRQALNQRLKKMIKDE